MSSNYSNQNKLRPPKLREVFYELSALKDVVALASEKNKSFISRSNGQSQHVLMLPGLGAGHWSFKPMQRVLERHGHICYDWELGRNLAGLNFMPKMEDLPSSWAIDQIPKKTGRIGSREIGVPYLCVRTMQRAKQLAEKNGHPIVLLGWSLGGLIAREVARELPEYISKVITIGSPVRGGPKYTITAWRFSRLGVDIDWIEDVINHRNERHIHQPITCIYSKRDGIVHWTCAIDDFNPNVQLYEVKASHLGMGINKHCWQLILNSLAS